MNLNLLDEIGRGASGVVWRAKDDLDRDLAVKFFYNSADVGSKAALEHAQALSAIDHPNVVRVYGIVDVVRPDSVDGKSEPALVMAFISGQSYADWLASVGKTRDQVEGVLSSLLDGLEAFHQRGLAHRDLHEGNVRVCNGRAMIIDPLAHDPGAVLSTALTQDRRRKDISDARYLIQQAVLEIAGNTVAVGNFVQLNSAATSVAGLREHVRYLLGRPLSVSDGLATSMYDLYRRAQSDGSQIDWQETKKTAIRLLQPELDQWRQNHQSLPSDDKERARLVFDAIGRIEPLLACVLADAEVGDGGVTSRREHDLLRRLLTVDWPRGGDSMFVELPSTFVYVAHYAAGAAHVLNDHILDAVKLLRMSVQNRHGQMKQILYTDALIGWPEALNRDCTIGFWILISAYTALPLLRRVFPTEFDYRSSLVQYNLIASTLEYCDTIKSRPDVSNLSLEAPPLFLLADRREIERASFVLRRDPDFRQHLLNIVKDAEKLSRLWGPWLQQAARFMARDARFAHIPEDLKKLFDFPSD